MDAAFQRAQRRRAEWILANGPCQYCGTWKPPLEIDHIVPVGSKFKRWAIWYVRSDAKRAELAKDIQVLCKACHRKKTSAEMEREQVHGTYKCYQLRNCRCDPCTVAWREYMREYRQRRPEVIRRAVKASRERHQGKEPPIHGYHGYQAYRCRCDVCRAANTEVVRRSREKKRMRQT